MDANELVLDIDEINENDSFSFCILLYNVAHSESFFRWLCCSGLEGSCRMSGADKNVILRQIVGHLLGKNRIDA